MAVCAALYAKTVGFDFVNWDDDFNITKNPNLQFLDWKNIKGIFTSHVIGNYNPLTTFTFLLERHLISEDPWIFHLDNVILHLLCMYFAFRVTRLLGLELLPSLLVASLFAIHPMRVESVAWITERKDVLFGVFYLAALAQYVKWIKSGKDRRYYIYIILLFVPALLAKIQAVALPLSFLAVDFLLSRKLRLKLIWEKIPFFALSAATGLIGVYFLSQQGSIGASDSVFSIAERLGIGAYSYIVYLIKFIFPYRMSPLYPYPAVLSWYHYASVAGIAVLAAWFFIAFRRRQRMTVFGLLFFTFNIMFVLQIVGAGQGYLADRFTYIPYLGLMIWGASYWNKLINAFPRYRNVIIGATGAYLLLFCYMTWKQIDVWKNSETLWDHVTKYYQNSALPYRNRATYLRDQKRFDEALKDYDRSLKLKKNADVLNSKARLYFDLKKWDEAIVTYDQAIDMEPNKSEFWVNRGAAYAMKGNYQKSLEDLNKGMELDPDNPNGLKNRSLIYLQLNQYEKAHQDILKYLQNNPYNPDIWYESGRLYRIQGKYQQALDDFNRAIRLNPNNGLFYLERSKAYLSLGQKNQARADLQQAQNRGVKVSPEDLRRYQ
jgi:tetratricopeptide (TPR) repeat protein